MLEGKNKSMLSGIANAITFHSVFFSRRPAIDLKKRYSDRFSFFLKFRVVLYSACHGRSRWRIPCGKSVNSPLLLMMGALVDDALRRLLSKVESSAAAAGRQRQRRRSGGSTRFSVGL